MWKQEKEHKCKMEVFQKPFTLQLWTILKPSFKHFCFNIFMFQLSRLFGGFYIHLMLLLLYFSTPSLFKWMCFFHLQILNNNLSLFILSLQNVFTYLYVFVCACALYSCDSVILIGRICDLFTFFRKTRLGDLKEIP